MMRDFSERSAEWIYHGVWRVLTDCFRVPQGPPTLPDQVTGKHRVFHPSRRYLAYLKAWFWFVLVLIDGALLIPWVMICLIYPPMGAVLAVPVLVAAVVPDIIAYVAIHLRFDTIWYGISARGVYVRRGIWQISEHSITIENIQNVSVRQGPIEQLFRISTVVIETAGSAAGEHDNVFSFGNQTIMVGIEEATEIRELLMRRVRASRFAGLGDDWETAPEQGSSSQAGLGLSGAELELLAQIGDEVRRLRATRVSSNPAH